MKHLETAMTLLSAIGALILVLALAYITIRWMGSKMSGQKGARVIKVIDRIMIGQDKCLLVVHVGGQTMLIGMSGDAVVKLSDLPELNDIDALQREMAGTPEFADVLRDALQGGWDKLTKKGTGKGDPSE